MLGYILVALAAYLIGSIPTGYVVARTKGIDIRTVGSGNIGATNAFRILGNTAGTLTLLADALKGFVAASWVCTGILQWLDLNAGATTAFHVVAGIGAVLGHNYTCWLGFRGGKGIATTAGVYFALAPLSVTIAIGVWTVVLFATRYVSIASITAAIALPVAVWITRHNLALGVATTALGALAIYKHKSNIQRLRAGTENRTVFRKEKPAA